MWWMILIGIGILLFFLRFTIVQEGTAKAVTKLGKFEKIIFQWEGHWMDRDWNIWYEGEEAALNYWKKKGIEAKNEEELRGKVEKKVRGRIFGGLWFYGIWPIHKIHRYRHRWTDLHRIEEKEGTIEKVQFHDEVLDHVLLKPTVYWTKIFAAETTPPERIPVDVGTLVTMRIFNPYLFLFVAPPTPVEDVLARIDALIRERTALLTIDEILSVRAETLWQGWKVKRDEKEIEIPPLKEEKLFKETLERWGFKVAEKGVDIKSIDPPKAYAEALARRRQLELEAEAKRVEYKIMAEARAAEIMGTVIEAVSTASGRKRKEVEEEFRKNPEEFYRKHKTVIDNAMTKLSMEERAYLRIETPGATGALGDLIRLIAAWQRMPRGRRKRKSEIDEEIERAKRTYKEGETFKKG
jgi:regulator of protease activity HflC (stomatin/prohibitin superfamily)